MGRGISVAAAIFGFLMIVAGFAVGGRYQVVGAAGGIYVVDRFTGDAKFCVADRAPMGVVRCKTPWSGLKLAK